VLSGLQRVQPGVVVQATSETVAMKDDGLPLDASPVPKEHWLTRPVRIGRTNRHESNSRSTVMNDRPSVDAAEAND
jgi:hypothetical protein